MLKNKGSSRVLKFSQEFK